MKKTKTPCLDLYYECMESQTLPKRFSGLCNYDLPNFEFLEPTDHDDRELGRNQMSQGWWGSGLKEDDRNKYYAFTHLRQNIVLLLACLNGEL